MNTGKYYLVLTDDLDSYYSCGLLQKMFPTLEVGGFFNFNGLFLNKERTVGKQPIYVDADMVNERCIGNHLPVFKNDNAINPNSGIKQYYKKYCLSTLIVIMSVFNYDISDMSIQNIIAALCIDSGYIGYFHKDGVFKHITTGWLKTLHLEPFVDALETCSEEAFIVAIGYGNLDAKIYINNGYLRSKINMKYNYKFEQVESFRKEFMKTEQAILNGKNGVVNAVETFSGRCVVCRKVERV